MGHVASKPKESKKIQFYDKDGTPNPDGDYSKDEDGKLRFCGITYVENLEVLQAKRKNETIPRRNSMG